MKVLVACEESQRVCAAFRKLGHEAYSCDIIDCSGGHPEWHIKQDVLPLLNGRCEFTTCDGKLHTISGKWDLIIAHPPCTYMSKAGARFMYLTAGNINRERLEKALRAKEFFMRFMNADCDKICIENPTPLKVVGLPKESQVIQPYQFGHPYSKRTLLWLKGLPMLIPTTPDCKPVGPYVPAGTGRKNREKYGAAKRGEDAKNRAKTFSGIARAMAEQWAGPVEAALKGGEGL